MALKKQQKRNLGILLVGAIALIVMAQFITLPFALNTALRPESYDVTESQISQTTDSFVYSFEYFDAFHSDTSVGCSPGESCSYEFIVPRNKFGEDEFSNMIKAENCDINNLDNCDIPLNVWFDARKVEFLNTQGFPVHEFFNFREDEVIRDLSTLIQETDGRCRVKELLSGSNNDVLLSTECIFGITLGPFGNAGRFYIGSRDNNFPGFSKARIEYEVLKTGVECTDSQLSLCLEGQTCENNLCNDINIDYYRFQDNFCTLINIPVSEKTSIDYETLEECQANIDTPPPSTCKIDLECPLACPNQEETRGFCVEGECTQLDIICNECTFASDCEGMEHLSVAPVGEWKCESNQCIWNPPIVPPRDFSILYIILGISGIGIVGFFVYRRFRK